MVLRTPNGERLPLPIEIEWWDLSQKSRGRKSLVEILRLGFPNLRGKVTLLAKRHLAGRHSGQCREAAYDQFSGTF